MRWMPNMHLYDQDPTLHMASVKPGAHRTRVLSRLERAAVTVSPRKS